MTTLRDFSAIRIKLASPENILGWSYGEVTKPETINYRTQKPEKEGLFSEAIFGPTKDWECYCGKYRRIRFKGIVCDKCGVEVTRAIVRRERMGHITLASPVSHIWFLRGVPSRMGLLLDVPVAELERVIYFASYIVMEVDEEARARVVEEIEREYRQKTKTLSSKEEKNQLKELRDATLEEIRRIRQYQVMSEVDYYDLSLKYGEVFKAGIGAESVRKIFEAMNLEKVRDEIGNLLERTVSVTEQQKLHRRLRLAESLIRSGIRPEWMLLTVVPIIPPDLRPMVQLDGGRFATSDVNDLYRRVINRNNRLKKLIELKAPEVIIRNEKRMLQEAVDALIDNAARRGQAATASVGGRKRPLRSLADMLRGKQGRFRQNLLGKRVDYSGRSVIVIGPELKLYQAGLPKRMALEIFKPFVINKLIYERQIAANIRSASRLIEEGIDEVWASLEEVIRDRAILLNRAPTLHRLGIQAFRPILIEGSAIQIHPLVCEAFNADFDGDQMAVHLPLSDEAQREAQEIMLSSTNFLKPATGEAIVEPRQDMILGIYWLTTEARGGRGEGKIFSSFNEAITAHEFGVIDLRVPIKARSTRLQGELIETTVGRIIFNLSLPKEIPFINKQMKKRDLMQLTNEIIANLPPEKVTESLDDMKAFGFHYATLSGISWGMNDLTVPQEKTDILDKARREVETIGSYYKQGLLTEEERKKRVIEVWTRTKEEVAKIVPGALNIESPIFAIFDSGARGSMGQLVQMAGMKGLVTNPANEIIELPVTSSFKEGFNVLEYFISTHGARKGTTDTALKTAHAGYLTRRLVDVAQDVVVHDSDCGDTEGVKKYQKDSDEIGVSLGNRVLGRISLSTVKDSSGKIVIRKNDIINKEKAGLVDELKLEEIIVRSSIRCRSTWGVCQRCFGYDLATNKLIGLGEAVGIVTAQAIGEPGTQLTMRTFHTGGVAGGADITQGLPRIEEVFEVRPPKGKAALSDVEGVVESIQTQGDQRQVNVSFSDKDKKKKTKVFLVPMGVGLYVEEGDKIKKGDQLCEGNLDLRELFAVSGQEAVENYVVKEIVSIYINQGASINEKYIEVIVRQMFSRVRIKDQGDTKLLPGDIVEKGTLKEANGGLKKNQNPATWQQLLLGITRVSLTTESFLSAASFQETARSLINAAVAGSIDNLKGLKENVIIGRLIPAGTAYRKRTVGGEEE